MGFDDVFSARVPYSTPSSISMSPLFFLRSVARGGGRSGVLLPGSPALVSDYTRRLSFD